MKGKWMIATGSPVDGFKYYGTFDDREDAIAFSEQNIQDIDWWIVKIQPKEDLQ